ncbi:MAG: nitroreductase family protein [Bacilli bacterium]|nr:nitroreductase family protein [Bacilli bacterium]MDD4077527.1 nitroreductase family protein [Bacilli bacterium]MDD4388427.1 nitroreductase family protein [Bacilli bacterium]
MNIKEIKELILKRASCRNFSDHPVEREKIEMIVEAARFAPSACNSQPWSVHVVTENEKRKKIAQAVQTFGINKFADKAPAFMIIVQEKSQLLPKLADLIKKVDYTAIDIGIFTAHLVLTATAAGLSTCIIGWFKTKKIRKIINTKNKIRLVIALGYGNQRISSKKRKEINEILKFYD